MSEGTLQREQANATLGKVVLWKDMRMSRVWRYDSGKLQVVQEVDGKDKVTGREWHSIKANFGRMEKKFKMDLSTQLEVDWVTAGYKFKALPEGILVEKLKPAAE